MRRVPVWYVKDVAFVCLPNSENQVVTAGPVLPSRWRENGSILGPNGRRNSKRSETRAARVVKVVVLKEAGPRQLEVRIRMDSRGNRRTENAGVGQSYSSSCPGTDTAAQGDIAGYRRGSDVAEIRPSTGDPASCPALRHRPRRALEVRCWLQHRRRNRRVEPPGRCRHLPPTPGSTAWGDSRAGSMS